MEQSAPKPRAGEHMGKSVDELLIDRARSAEAERDSLAAQNRELREEIAVIANSKWTNFEDASEFREWALNRCRSALAKHGR